MKRIVLCLSFCLWTWPAQAQISTDLWLGGAIRVGVSTTECDANAEGAIRWNATDKAHEVCDGSEWKYLYSIGGTGTPSIPPAGTGYFVLSHGSWSGDLGAFDGAHAKCLADLTAQDWLNKADAVSRGLLDASHVKAFLCEAGSGGVCVNPMPGVTYTFAVSGNPTYGGAVFVTDDTGRGPGNAQNWTGSNYFGTTAEYWAARSSSSAILWGTSGGGTSASNDCANWNTVSGSGYIATANATNGNRWFISSATSCSGAKKLVCMVHP